MNPLSATQLAANLSRRAFLGRASQGLGRHALASLLAPAAFIGSGQRSLAAELLAPGRLPPAADSDGPVVAPLHHPARIKRVIWLYMAGGMSHLETFDPKPELAKRHGQPMPESITKGQQIAQLQGSKLRCFGPQHPFTPCGRSGLEISSVFPHLSRLADELCVIRSMHTEAINHDPAHTLMNTGSMISGRPSAGSWLLYGLGSPAENLPGFVVMVSTGKYGQSQPIAARQWSSGFLPSRFQGVEFRSRGEPVLYVGSPPGVTAHRQRDLVDTVAQLTQFENQLVADPEIDARVSQYEMAFRMQTGVPELLNLADEPRHILDLYGTPGGDGSFAANCLLARRLAERGVRMIQLYHRDWDHHSVVKDHIAGVAGEVDRGVAALLTDLKQRGMLDETLVVFGTEFGRTPMAQGNGRDHHLAGFSIWLAGGGVRPGIAWGATDEFGYHAIDRRVHVNDLHATLLHLFGVDHLRLVFRFQGRDFRLTDIAGNVLHDLLT